MPFLRTFGQIFYTTNIYPIHKSTTNIYSFTKYITFIFKNKSAYILFGVMINFLLQIVL